MIGLNIGQILNEMHEKEKTERIVCGICKKDFTDIAHVLGTDAGSKHNIFHLHARVHQEELRSHRKDYAKAVRLIADLEEAMRACIRQYGESPLMNERLAEWWKNTLAGKKGTEPR